MQHLKMPRRDPVGVIVQGQKSDTHACGGERRDRAHAVADRMRLVIELSPEPAAHQLTRRRIRALMDHRQLRQVLRRPDLARQFRVAAGHPRKANHAEISPLERQLGSGPSDNCNIETAIAET